MTSTSLTAQDIRNIPSVLRQTALRVEEYRELFAPLLHGPLYFLGCGSSHCVAEAAALLYESTHNQPAQARMASDYQPRPGWTHIVISRTGQTTELLRAMQRLREQDPTTPILLIRGDSNSPAEAFADVVLPLEFATEAGIIQTSFIAAALYALRLLIGGPSASPELAHLPQQVEQSLVEFDPKRFNHYTHYVFLGRGWYYGLARNAALNQQETALLVPECHQTLEYRHGPIAAAGPQTLVWCFDEGNDLEAASVIADVKRTGAGIYHQPDDPLVALTQAFTLAIELATRQGIDPDAPRHLSRAIILPEGDTI